MADHSFEFNKIHKVLDIIEPPMKKELATKEQINEMLAFIGGFEKWSVLPEDCRREVVKYVGYTTRCDLGVCSRKDHETVKSTPIHVEEVRIAECPIRGGDTRSPNPFSDCNTKAAQFAEKWIKKGQFKVDRIAIKMTNFPFETCQLKTLTQCKHADIFIDDVDSFNWLVEKLPEQLDYLSISHFSATQALCPLPCNILSKPQVMQASQLYIGGRAEITNEQFIKLNAQELDVKPTDVTAQGVNQYIENRVNGKGVRGFKFLKLRVDRNFDLDVLLVGLGARYWDEEFEAEAPEFVRMFRRKAKGRCFQIQSQCIPYYSLTLNLGEDVVRLVATGFRGERDGEPCQNYICPSFHF